MMTRVSGKKKNPGKVPVPSGSPKKPRDVRKAGSSPASSNKFKKKSGGGKPLLESGNGAEKRKRNKGKNIKLTNELSDLMKELRTEGGKDAENFGVPEKPVQQRKKTKPPKDTTKSKDKTKKSFLRNSSNEAGFLDKPEKKKRANFQGSGKGGKRNQGYDDFGEVEFDEEPMSKKPKMATTGMNKKKRFSDFEEIPGAVAHEDDAEEAAHWHEHENQESLLTSDPKFANMLILPGTGEKWFTLSPSLGDLREWPDLNPRDVSALIAEADGILAEDARIYRSYLSKRPEKKDFRWVDTVMKSGTVADKMAAFVVLVQDSPIHNYERIGRMINLAASKSRREALMAIDTLREVFLSDLLAENRKLRCFRDQPLSRLDAVVAANRRNGGDDVVVRQRILAVWRFEDLIKECYGRFVSSVVALVGDAVESTRFRTLHTLYSLLLNNPELEKKLLEAVVNKLGDPGKKVAASTAHRLTQLLTYHPNMKLVVCEEVEHFVFRPNVGERAQYYAACLLSQILLSNDDEKVAVKLIIVYLSLFKAYLAKDALDKKIITAILTGVRRAFPYAKETLKREADAAKVAAAEERAAAISSASGDAKPARRGGRIPTPGARLLSDIDGLFKAVHASTSFPVAVRSLTVLEMIAECHGEYADRFYRSLYRKLMDPALADSSAVSIFLALLYRAVCNDPSDNRRLAFLKRILQLCHLVPTALCCGLLVIASKLMQKNPEFLDASRAAATSLLTDKIESGVGDDDDDEEEKYFDADLDVRFNVLSSGGGSAAAGSWVHVGHRPGTAESKSKSKSEPSSSGEHDLRNPESLGAATSVAWELERLRSHYHPTVRLFAARIAGRQPVSYDGDPLRDFALGHFLDRFVQRNPKEIDNAVAVGGALGPAVGARGRASKWEPTAKDVVFGSRGLYEPGLRGTRRVKATDEDFMRTFAELKPRKKTPVEKESAGDDEDGGGSDDDVESVSDAEFDEYLNSVGLDDDDEQPDVDEAEDPDLDLDFDDEDDDVDFAAGVGEASLRGGVLEDDDDDGFESDDGDLSGPEDSVSGSDDDDFEDIGSDVELEEEEEELEEEED